VGNKPKALHYVSIQSPYRTANGNASRALVKAIAKINDFLNPALNVPPSPPQVNPPSSAAAPDATGWQLGYTEIPRLEQAAFVRDKIFNIMRKRDAWHMAMIIMQATTQKVALPGKISESADTFFIVIIPRNYETHDMHNPNLQRKTIYSLQFTSKKIPPPGLPTIFVPVQFLIVE